MPRKLTREHRDRFLAGRRVLHDRARERAEAIHILQEIEKLPDEFELPARIRDAYEEDKQDRLEWNPDALDDITHGDTKE